MSKLAGLWVCASAGVAVYGVLTLPTWLLASMNRSTLWSLRDRAFDARRAGALPDTPVVDRFIGHLETLIVVLPTITALQVWWFRRYHDDLLRSNARPLFEELGESDELEHRCLSALQEEARRIILRQVLVGSWSGLLLVVPRHWQDLREVLRRHDSDDGTGLSRSTKRWRERDVVAEVEQVVPHVGKRRDKDGKRRAKDLIAAAG